MELFRKMDGLAEDVQKLQSLVDLWSKFLYCTSISGTILGSVDHMQTQDFEKKEKRILMGVECTSIKPTVEGVKVGISLLKGGKVEEMNFRCSFVIGSDGARSTVRKLVGTKMQGERDLQKLVSVHFLSKDLGQYLLHKRPGMLFFIFNPEAIGVLVAHDLDEGEFVLQVV